MHSRQANTGERALFLHSHLQPDPWLGMCVDVCELCIYVGTLNYTLVSTYPVKRLNAKFLPIFFVQSKDECEYLINLGKPHMKKSTVVDSATGKSTDSRYEYSTS